MRNIFIIHYPGLGGNHLLNLISLSEIFPSIDISNYDNISKNAHFSQMQNINFQYIEKNLASLLRQNNVFCGHLREYLDLKYDTDYYDKFENKFFVIIQLPRQDLKTLAYKRLVTHNYLLSYKPYFYSEQDYIYSQRSIKNLLEEPDFYNNSIQFDSDLLFSNDISKIVSTLETLLNIKLDQDKAAYIHRQWLNMLHQTLKINTV